MAKMNIPSDVTQAINVLESWEKSLNRSERMRDFEDAMEILNDYIKDDDYQPIHSYAKNIRRTYTRKLLEELPSLPSLQKGEWFHIIKILFLSVPDEVEAITKETPSLAKNESDFLTIWVDELLEKLNNKLKKIK